MFNFLKRATRGKVAERCPTPLLKYKDNKSAFEMACKYLNTDLSPDVDLAALVVDHRSMEDMLLGRGSAVRIDESGNQVMFLQISSSDGGFLAVSKTLGPNGPRLVPGDLVAWRAEDYLAGAAHLMNDPKSGWVGLVIAKLKPEYVDGAWIIDERFS